MNRIRKERYGKGNQNGGIPGDKMKVGESGDGELRRERRERGRKESDVVSLRGTSEEGQRGMEIR